MLYVFSVDIGEMYSFEMELAMESVQTLMSAIASTTGIPVDKQVLLVTGGEALDPEDRVCNYSNTGTDTSPIYLFSKSTIESSVPPSTSLNFGSESSLKEQVEVSFKLPPTYETLVSRAQLASNFNHFAMEIASNCERLVNEQSLQQLGWGAVVSNLDNISKEFNERATTVELSYKEFLESRSRYLQLLQGYSEVLHVLAKIPILPGLVHGKHAHKPGMPGIRDGISLLDWISAQDQKNSLQDMVDQCSKALEQFDDTVLQAVMTDVIQVREALNNSSMKEIKGLDERLLRLQELLQRVKELVQSQAEMAQGFIQNQTRAQNLGDPSVLPDLCTSHQKQLMMLMKNHSQLRDYLRRCARAKEELSTNLHTRLRWIMYVEKKICDSDGTLIIYHENIRRVRRRLEILDQVCEAPRLYMLASTEVARRHKFSSQFMKWASKLHESVCQILSEENAKREEFTLKFGRHFLQTLFTGLDDRPSKFADRLPKSFDVHLPIITEQDVSNLQSIVPEFKEYFDESSINVSMKDSSTETSSLSMVLKLQDSQMAISQDPVKELSISKTSMSVDASTQAIWMTDRQEVVGESRDSAEQIKKNLKDASRSSIDDSASYIQPSEESPPKGYHRDSDTGSEPSSGLTDSDIMFRSAQEDYVTVVESDLESKDGSTKGSSVQSSQTITLTSSGSQSITTSTQTDISLDEKLICSEILEDSTREKTDSIKDKETITNLENRINELENELSRTTLDYNKTLQDNEKLFKSNSSLKEFIETTVVELRQDFIQCKGSVTSFKSKMNSDVEIAWSDFQRFVNEFKGSLSEMSTKTAKEYEDIMKQLNERHEQETNELMHLKSQLEVEKSAIGLELQKVTEEKSAKEAQSIEEFENLKAVLEEYKTRCENQQQTLTRQKDIRIKTEEEQQTRFNSIIQSLTKEKKLIVGQLNEKVKEMELEIGKQNEKLKVYDNERESFIKEREFNFVGLQERDEKLSSMQAQLQQAEAKWSQRENEFKSQLEKEKANALLLLEVERQMWEASNTRQEDTEMTDSSVRLPSEVSSLNAEQKLAQLEKEYKAAREKLESQQEAISHALHQFQEGEVNPILNQAKLALVSKDEQIKSLKKQLVQQVTGSVGAEALKPEKVSLKDFQCGDLILLVFDPRYENYLIFSTGTTLYFLHPDSMAGLDLAISGAKRRDWVLAHLTDKEYCQAKKAQNRFHVPAGTKFYRIQAKPWER